MLAHETAHVRQRHIARAVQAQGRTSLASTAAMLAAILIGAAAGADGQAIEGAIAMSQGIAMQQIINFTRSEEAEADRVGIGLLAGAGFNAYRACPISSRRWSRSEGVSDARPLDLLRTHPVTRERIAEARARAAQYPQRGRGGIQPVSRGCASACVCVTAGADTDMTLRTTPRLRDRRALSDAGTLRRGAGPAARQDHAADAVPTLSARCSTQHPEITALYGSLGQALQAAGQPGRRAAAVRARAARCSRATCRCRCAMPKR